jgi:hypothetical protein
VGVLKFKGGGRGTEVWEVRTPLGWGAVSWFGFPSSPFFMPPFSGNCPDSWPGLGKIDFSNNLALGRIERRLPLLSFLPFFYVPIFFIGL